MSPKINLVTLSASEVAANEDDYNSSFHNASEAPNLPPTIPSELPTRFAAHLPLILESQNLHPSSLQLITLTPSQCRLLLLCSTASLHTRRFNLVYTDDLAEELTPSFSTLKFPPQGLFIRLDACSPKDGENGIKPLRSVNDIYLRLTTSYRACNSIQRFLDREGGGDAKNKLELFFLPFNAEMDTSFEYRVFCAPEKGTHWSPDRNRPRQDIDLVDSVPTSIPSTEQQVTTPPPQNSPSPSTEQIPNPVLGIQSESLKSPTKQSEPAAKSTSSKPEPPKENQTPKSLTPSPTPPQVTAISQYRWHKPSSLKPLLPTSSPAFQETINLITREAIRIHTLIISTSLTRDQIQDDKNDKESKGVNMNHLLFKQGFVFDIRFIPDSSIGNPSSEKTHSEQQTVEGIRNGNGNGKGGGRCELIELNTFGSLSACGACLFHWLRDEDVLYGLGLGEERAIEFRIAV